MPKRIVNPEKEELRCQGQGSRSREGSSRTSLDSTAIDTITDMCMEIFMFLVYRQLFTFGLFKTT